MQMHGVEQLRALSFDPIYFAKETLTAVIIVGILGAVYVFRKSILLAVSGDDRVHLTCLDCLWWGLCRCCGCCSGDWTRCLTRCPCCPRRVRGSNLVVEGGQWLGLTSYSVELKNIVVGDLPTYSRGNFYIAVECAANPELVTSLAEEKLPKVVHFPETITLRLRWSQLEQQVRIVVKALRVVGSTDLCQAFFDPNDVLHWSKYQSHKVMRFEMKTVDPSYQAETPPWIAVQFSQPTEFRDLEHFHGDMDTVRTANDDGHYNDMNVRDFKSTYHLLDQGGSAIQEPLEEDLMRVRRLKCLCDFAYWFCNAWTFLVILGYLLFRFYTWSCWRQFRMQAIAYLRGEQFPVPIHRLDVIMRQCDKLYKGTGIGAGNTTCRPTSDEVLKFCKEDHPRLQDETGQPPPHALRMLVYKTFGVVIPGVPCFEGICDVRAYVAEVDWFLYGICIFLVVFACCCRIGANSAVRHLRHNQASRRSNRMTALNAMMSGESAKSGSPTSASSGGGARYTAGSPTAGASG